MINLDKTDKILIAGYNTLLGLAIAQELQSSGFNNLLGQDLLNLCDNNNVEQYFITHRPDYVIYCAGKSGGIKANSLYPADFYVDNILSATHVINNSYKYKIKKLIYLASSCIYPKNCPQPMTEADIFTGKLESTNEAYATAKLSGLVMCQAYAKQYGCDFITAVPTNYFGDIDFNRITDPDNLHVVASLLYRFHKAVHNNEPRVTIWGTGEAKREFLYINDIAHAVVYLLQNVNTDTINIINIGGGETVSIKQLAYIIKDITAYQGEIDFDTSKPDGMPIKILDNTLIKNLGWQSSYDFKSVLKNIYKKNKQVDHHVV